MKANGITGDVVSRIVKAFVSLLEILEESKDKKKDGEGGGGGGLPLGWIEAATPTGSTIFVNKKTGVLQFDTPVMTISDLPYNDNSCVKMSSLETFQHIPEDYYETLDKAFESAGFKDLAEIRKRSQDKVKTLTESGKLRTLGMSKEEAEVLFSYTFEVKKPEKKEFPCYVINKVLARRDTNALRNCRGYILHLLKALRKLNPIKTEGVTLYRGIDGSFLNFDENYKEGKILSWPAFTSTSLSVDIVYDKFLKRAAQPVIFEIHGNFIGYDISQFSFFTKECEILLEPETIFKIVSIQKDTQNINAKRIIIEVQKMSLMIENAVTNFGLAEQRQPFQHRFQQKQQQPPQPLERDVIPMSPPPPQYQQYQQQQFPQQQQFQPFQPMHMLPPGWRLMIDQRTGRPYYFNVETRETQWEYPIAK